MGAAPRLSQPSGVAALLEAQELLAELRTNAAVVRAALDNAGTDAQTRAALDVIGSAAARLERVIQRGLSQAKTPLPSAIRVSAVVAESAQEADRLATARGLRVRLRHGTDGDIPIDRSVLSRLLYYLMNAALRVCSQGIDVEYERGETALVLTVSFVRGEGAEDSSPTLESSELGLSFCRATAHAHGGDIHVEHCFGTTRFVAKIPIP